MSGYSRRRLWRALAAILLPVFPALLGCFHVLNADIGFHIATGRAIEALGRVPTTNVLSFAQPDQPWVLHQWIPAWLFYHVETAAGVTGLVLLKCAILYATFLLLWLAMTRRAGAIVPVLPWYAAACGAAASRFFIRPFLFSMLGLALFFYLVSRWEEERKPGWLYGAAVATALFATLHAGVVYILLSFGALAAAALVTGNERRHAGAAFGLALLVSGAAAALESPHGLEALTLPFRFSTHAYFHAHLVEFRPLPFSLNLYPYTWLLLLVLPLLGAAHVWRHRERRRDRRAVATWLFEFALLAGFTFLVLKHRRIVFAHALVAAFLAARWGRALHLPDRRWVAGALAGVAAVLAVLAAGGQFAAARFGPGLDRRFYPERLFDFVARKALPDPAYVSDAWGGHWLWRFYPQRRVFYDNRLEAYSFEFYRDVYQAIRYAEPGWQDKLDAFGINVLVLKYSTPGERRFQEGRPNVRDLAFAGTDWRLVFWDDLGEIFVRADPARGGCADCPVYARFNPDTLQPAAGAAPETVLAELYRVWSLIPSARACFALVTTLERAGRPLEATGILLDGLRQYPDNPLLEQLARRLGNTL